MNQSPHMLNAAHGYLRASQVLWAQPNLSAVSNVNAAIGIEILLKSFIAEPVDNERIDTYGENYLVRKRFHKLTELSNQIEPDIYKKLRLERYEKWFEMFDNLFIEARYPYEAGAKNSYSEVPIDIGVELFNIIMQWYKDTDSKDIWIRAYPDVPGGRL